MISFRYQMAAVTAVFLAVAVGLTLGTAASGGAPADARTAELTEANGALTGEVGRLRADVEAQQRFADEAAAMLLPGRLSDRRVAVVVLPGGGDAAEKIVKLLASGGATVTGRVDLAPAFLDPGNVADLLDLATRSVPPSAGNALPADGDGVESSAALLAAVLMDRTPAVTVEDTRSVLSAYSSQNLLAVPGGPVRQPAEAVVIVGGATVAGDRGRAAYALVDQFSKAGPTVVASTVDGDGGVIGTVRADPRLADSVSTVDNVTAPPGRVAAALAVVEKLTGRTGHYGTGSGTALLPRPL